MLSQALPAIISALAPQATCPQSRLNIKAKVKNILCLKEWEPFCDPGIVTLCYSPKCWGMGVFCVMNCFGSDHIGGANHFPRVVRISLLPAPRVMEVTPHRLVDDTE